jgi:hypothetical protein
MNILRTMSQAVDCEFESRQGRLNAGVTLAYLNRRQCSASFLLAVRCVRFRFDTMQYAI